MVDSVRGRLRFILGFFAVITGLILIRLVSLQFGSSVAYFETQRDLASSYRVQITAPRGKIFDRDGELLATNDVQYAIGISPDFVTNPESVAKILSTTLSRPYSELYAMTQQKSENGQPSKYVLVQRPVPAEIGEKLIAMQKDLLGPNLAGVVVEPMQRRVYPGGVMAAHVLGFVGYDSKGYFGVEEFYNDVLTGRTVTGIKQVVPFDVALNPNPAQGSDLYLTLDREIQSLTEQVLNDALKRYGAESGTIIVMEPKTGRILALAVAPSFDPNKFVEQNIKPNPVVSAQFEPGSGFKIITMASALQSGVVTPESKYVDTGFIEVGGVTIRNWNRAAWGPQDMTGVLQHSLNVGSAMLAVKMGPQKYYNYLSAFGIGQPTNIDLSGEATGRVKRPGDRDWYESDLGTNAFGQGVATTPIQLLVAASAVANQGAMMQPHLLEKVVDGNSVHSTRPQVLGRPISPDVANMLSNMLQTSVERETASVLVKGYKIAGKTGTAQIPIPGGYDKDKTIATFIGWGPVDDPQFIVLVKLDKPSTSIWGSETAAPTFGELAKRLVVLMKIPPDNVRRSLNQGN